MITKITKKDIILVITIILLSICFLTFRIMTTSSGEAVVVIKVTGEENKIVPLSENQEIKINGGTNTLVIENGKVYMKEADCPDQICVNQGEISKDNETIVCLPNEVVVLIEADSKSEIDVISK